MTDILIVLQLLISIVLASQGIFYILGLAQAVKKISIQAFAEQRNAIDDSIAIKLKFLYYSALVVGIVVLILIRNEYSSLRFLCIALSTFFTLIDILLALRFNIPINNAFRSYPKAHVDWNGLRATWVKFLIIRGLFSIAAMIMLLFAGSLMGL